MLGGQVGFMVYRFIQRQAACHCRTGQHRLDWDGHRSGASPLGTRLGFGRSGIASRRKGRNPACVTVCTTAHRRVGQWRLGSGASFRWAAPGPGGASM